jgi:hypothetical protein
MEIHYQSLKFLIQPLLYLLLPHRPDMWTQTVRKWLIVELVVFITPLP